MNPASDEHPRLPGPLSARDLLRRQFRLAHTLLETAVEQFPTDAFHRGPSGMAAPTGARYAQVVLCEDLSVNGLLARGTPLALSAWAGRTGLSELPPLVGTVDWRAWAHRVRLDRAKLRRYAQAVYASTDVYIAALAEEELTTAGGDAPLRLLSGLLLSLSMRRGEIACLLELS